MPLISVVTPTQARNADWIGETYDSLAGQVLPDGWEWEWLVQEDGAQPAVHERLDSCDERIRYDSLGVQAGGPATRNAALARARGDLVAGMDHDDLFLDGGLAALIDALETNPDASWVCGRCLWLLPDGNTWVKPDVVAPGVVPAGWIGDYLERSLDWPFPAAHTVYRREPLIAAGGWPALARSEDAGLLASFSFSRSGFWVDRLVSVYRRWSGQKTVDPADIAIRDVIRSALLGRLAAQRAVSRAGPRMLG